jgi:hypothetical protein
MCNTLGRCEEPRLTWQVVASGTTENLYSLWGASGNDVWAAGDDGTVIHCVAGACAVVDVGTTRHLRAVWGTSATNVWVGGQAIAHYDGAWTIAMPLVSGIGWGMWGFGPSDIYHDGAITGEFLHYDGRSWYETTQRSPNFGIMWGSSSAGIWAVGRDGVVYHHDGVGWSMVDIGTEEDLNAVGGTSASDIWIGGPRLLMHFDGRTWRNRFSELSPAGTVAAIWASSTAGVMVALGGRSLRLEGGSWSEVDVPATTTIKCIREPSPGELWAVGTGGSILRFE